MAGHEQVVVVSSVVPEMDGFRVVLSRVVASLRRVLHHFRVRALVCLDVTVVCSPVQDHALLSHQGEGDDGRVAAPVTCVALEVLGLLVPGFHL